MSDYLDTYADIDCDYRYALRRKWNDGTAPRYVLWVCLNPSTADGTQDDPSIRKMVGFSKKWGLGEMVVTNLFAWRATKPSTLFEVAASGGNIEGPRNQKEIEHFARRAVLIIAAWGNHGTFIDQDETVMGWIEGSGSNAPIMALDLNKSGCPKHPLYTPYKTKLIPYSGRPV